MFSDFQFIIYVFIFIGEFTKLFLKRFLYFDLKVTGFSFPNIINNNHGYYY